MSKLTTNITDARLDAIMEALPDEMDESELCALTLTMFSAYCEKQADIIPALIATIYAFGMSKGLSRESISIGLRKTADLHDSKPQTQH
jgi:hypothetical protein